MIVVLIVAFAMLHQAFSFVISPMYGHQAQKIISRRISIVLSEKKGTSSFQVSDLSDLSVREVLASVCGNNRENYRERGLLFNNVDIFKGSPTVGKFIIANPKGFCSKPIVAKSHGFDVESLLPTASLESLDYQLPVVYIADIHPEYGTLGYMLHRESVNASMAALYPSLKSFRTRPIYSGGIRPKGSAFTMLHRKVGFPENRQFRSPPGETDKKLFFSPDVAMANELCLTGDADPKEFKFFQWATVWLPKQLNLEYDDKLWITISAPLEVLFEDNQLSKPLWKRLVLSLPPDRLLYPGDASTSAAANR
mmetsp:Transcript_15046/g.22230  ORF Transcript_15046/g.22230 Transcript_15046/m.22230 type:complete len:309 (-) Transcript_15046:484-1410(-)